MSSPPSAAPSSYEPNGVPPPPAPAAAGTAGTSGNSKAAKASAAGSDGAAGKKLPARKQQRHSGAAAAVVEREHAHRLVPDDRRVCDVCLCLVKDAMQTGCCGHPVCRECVEAVLNPERNPAQTCFICKAEGSAPVRDPHNERLAANTVMFCEYPGCDFRAKRDDFNEHHSMCLRRPVAGVIADVVAGDTEAARARADELVCGACSRLVRRKINTHATANDRLRRELKELRAANGNLRCDLASLNSRASRQNDSFAATIDKLRCEVEDLRDDNGNLKAYSKRLGDDNDELRRRATPDRTRRWLDFGGLRWWGSASGK